MTKFRTIFALSLLLFTACNGEDTDLIEEQREDIVSFLTTKHSPKLIAEGDVTESLDNDPEFYTTSGYTAYRWIEDYYNSDRLTRTEVATGDVIELTFWIYDFSTFATPSDSYLFFTNDPSYEDALDDAGLTTEYWSFEPKRVTLGNGDILKSIETSLVGCREGDKVEIYLTYNMAYGDMWMGVTTIESPIAFFCTIDSIEN